MKIYKKIQCALLMSLAMIAQLLNIEFCNVVEQILIVGPGSLFISLITAFFVSMVFALQVTKEFLYLNAVGFVGTVLTLAFIRELSPVLTSVIVIGRVGSRFTSEIATMKVTEQIDALYLLNANPLAYLVMPRILSCIIVLPALNFLAFATSLASSAFICFTLYAIDPTLFFTSCFSSLNFTDLAKSLLKSMVFGIVISITSCFWGLSTRGGARGVGNSTTISVVTSLLSVFILDFIMSYLMFYNLDSSIQSL